MSNVNEDVMSESASETSVKSEGDTSGNSSFTGQTSQHELTEDELPRKKKSPVSKVSIQPVLGIDARETAASNASEDEIEAAKHTSVKSKSRHRKIEEPEEERKERKERKKQRKQKRAESHQDEEQKSTRAKTIETGEEESEERQSKERFEETKLAKKLAKKLKKKLKSRENSRRSLRNHAEKIPQPYQGGSGRPRMKMKVPRLQRW